MMLSTQAKRRDSAFVSLALSAAVLCLFRTALCCTES